MLYNETMMRRAISLFEHQYLPFSEDPLLADRKTQERVLDDLDAIQQRARQEMIRIERKGLRALSYVGLFQTRDLSIEVLPKIDFAQASETQRRWTATQNLLSMLSYAYDVDIKNIDLAGLEPTSGAWVDVLTYIFLINLRQQVQVGLFSDYVPREETLPVLRGHWDIQRQIKQHGFDQPFFDVTYHDYSPDIPLNQIFRYVLEILQNSALTSANQALLEEVVNYFQPISLLTDVSEALIQEVQFNRLNQRFEPLFHLAQLFLAGNIPQFHAGDLQTYAFGFDMGKLFERFNAAFLTAHRSEILSMLQGSFQIIPQARFQNLTLAKKDGKNLFHLRPDILLVNSQTNQASLFIDSKYKRLTPSARSLGVTHEDLYQMLAYATRLNCPLGLILYPQIAEEQPLRQVFDIENTQTRIGIATINLNGPLQTPSGLIQEWQDLLTWVSGLKSE